MLRSHFQYNSCVVVLRFLGPALVLVLVWYYRSGNSTFSIFFFTPFHLSFFYSFEQGSTYIILYLREQKQLFEGKSKVGPKQ